ncbi:MAG: hypothetical protein J6R42_04020 [Clostridia bacterium]|nr:hypothetical protein [Clostridia bacterium]
MARQSIPDKNPKLKEIAAVRFRYIEREPHILLMQKDKDEYYVLTWHPDDCYHRVGPYTAEELVDYRLATYKCASEVEIKQARSRYQRDIELLHQAISLLRHAKAKTDERLKQSKQQLQQLSQKVEQGKIKLESLKRRFLALKENQGVKWLHLDSVDALQFPYERMLSQLQALEHRIPRVEMPDISVMEDECHSCKVLFDGLRSDRQLFVFQLEQFKSKLSTIPQLINDIKRAVNKIESTKIDNVPQLIETFEGWVKEMEMYEAKIREEEEAFKKFSHGSIEGYVTELLGRDQKLKDSPKYSTAVALPWRMEGEAGERPAIVTQDTINALDLPEGTVVTLELLKEQKMVAKDTDSLVLILKGKAKLRYPVAAHQYMKLAESDVPSAL